MTYNKDTQRDNHFANQGHSLMSLTESLANKEENEFFMYLSKRTEKVITALYMVTDLMDTGESIKDKLRSAGVELLSEMHFGRASSCMMSLTESIVSFLRISFSVGLISEMNFSILEREFVSIISNLGMHEENKRNRINEDIFGADFFDTNTDMPSSLGDKGQIKDIQKTTQQNIKDTTKTLNYLSSSIRPNLANKLANKESIKDNQTERGSRKQEILNILKEKKEVTIKDISHVISGVSEKTLQRELVALVSAGILLKEGKKRWSKYSLK